ncbi:MAG: tetraacyldisaccharide 4'-kinase [Candidatus Omnitrophota bacterium]
MEMGQIILKGFLRYKKGVVILKPLLFIFSMLYFLCFFIRRFAYRFGIYKSFKFTTKVISIGNITVGGTGKTPLVILLADFLKKSNKHVIISTRGYGGDYVEKGLVVNATTDIKGSQGTNFLGDEVCLLRRYLKDISICVGKDRVRMINEALKTEKPEMILLDDGFQHLRVKRDLDVVLINGLNPFGNKGFIPYGILRAPLSLLKYADIFVITKVDLIKDVSYTKNILQKINPSALIVYSQHLLKGIYEAETEKELDVAILKKKTVNSVCAIGDPESFEKLLCASDITVQAHYRFIDHHKFKAEEIRQIIKTCISSNIDIVITTEKDMARLEEFLKVFKQSSIVLLYTKIEFTLIENKEAFFKKISSL